MLPIEPALAARTLQTTRLARWRRAPGVVNTLAVGMAALALACAKPAEVADESAKAAPLRSGGIIPWPADTAVANPALARSVNRGAAILRHTADSLPTHVGNGLQCTSCHLSDGRVAGAMPWVGVYARFPQYRSRSGGVDVLADRINDCFQRSLNGKAMDPAGADMRDITAYMAWLSRGTVLGKRTPGQGLDSVAAALTPDSAAGRVAYVAQCSRCHGANGEGMTTRSPGVPDWAGVAPPLWGPRSYNIGAGMARVRAAAAFIRHQMPLDTPGSLSDQQALDIAAFVNAQPRPDFADKVNDWPLGGEPSDVAYTTNRMKREAGGAGPGRGRGN
ncbi:MAG: c-type cytochrome [Gemmatimonadetes bacterium]|nr:c-type cytochrome [Gemmatimonadota bacterium]